MCGHKRLRHRRHHRAWQRVEAITCCCKRLERLKRLIWIGKAQPALLKVLLLELEKLELLLVLKSLEALHLSKELFKKGHTVLRFAYLNDLVEVRLVLVVGEADLVGSNLQLLQMEQLRTQLLRMPPIQIELGAKLRTVKPLARMARVVKFVGFLLFTLVFLLHGVFWLFEILVVKESLALVRVGGFGA